MFEKRVSKAVDQWDHTNAMGHGIVWIITFIPMLLVASAVGGWGWLVIPLLWMAIMLLNWYRDSTQPLSEYEKRNGPWEDSQERTSADSSKLVHIGYDFFDPSELIDRLGFAVDEVDYLKRTSCNDDEFLRAIDEIEPYIEPTEEYLEGLRIRLAALPSDADDHAYVSEDLPEADKIRQMISDGENYIARAEKLVSDPSAALATWRASKK